MGYIYKITNLTNNKVYIGQTVRHYTERWADHKRDRIKEPYCNWPLYRMLNSVKPENVSWEVIEEIDNELLNERESYWIAYYNSKEQGYNCTSGANNGTKHNYEEILQYWLDEGQRNFTKTALHFNSSKSYISQIIHGMGYSSRTWEEINNTDHSSCYKAVNQIDMNTGKVLNTYVSITEAAKAMGNINYRKTISSVCTGLHPSYLGYCWQHVEDIGKPICLNKQQKYIILPEKNLVFNTLKECALWFIQNNLCRSKSPNQVSSAIRYALTHSGYYQHIKIEEKAKEIVSYYED